MLRRDYFYGSKHFRGLGKMFFLKVPLRAAEGSSNRKLLGSVVDEIDYGFFGSCQAPKPEHYFDAEHVLKQLRQLQDTGQIGDLLEDYQELAGFKYNLSVKREFGTDIDLSFPGLPMEAGLEVDYNSLRKVEIELGAGARRYYIPAGRFDELCRAYDGDETRIHPDMEDDKMIIQSIIVARSYSSKVSFSKDFEADVSARIDSLSSNSSGLSMQKNSERALTVEFDGETDYLIALSGIQWEHID